LESGNLEQTVEKIVDNSDVKMGPCLIDTGIVDSTPSISNDERIFQSGARALTERILSIIREAEDFVCLSSFIIQDSNITDEIKRSYSRGVRVYILTSAEVNAKDPAEDIEGTDTERTAASRKLLEELGGRTLIKTGENLHSKFILADPLTRPRGMIFTANLTVRAITQNLELAVELSKKEVLELYRQFLAGFWVVAARTISLSKDTGNSLRTVKKYPEFAGNEYSPQEIRWTIGDQCLIKDDVGKAIAAARESISLSAWTIDISHPVAMSLLEKASEGIKLTIFTRPDMKNIDFINEVVRKGGKVYCHPLLHAKSLIVDDVYGLVMTANVSKLGLDGGFETGVILNARQIPVLKNIHEEWKRRAMYVSEPRIKLSEIKRRRLDLGNKLLTIDPPVSLKEVKHGKVMVNNLGSYFKKEWEPDKVQNDYTALKIKHLATLIPPLLPKGAKKSERQENGNLSVYELQKQKFICIKNEDQLSEGKSLASQLGARLVLCT
jgi:phosphatidylserine/phosphatidylglycerophosphate/cardiolipin synthase-like enzyme